MQLLFSLQPSAPAPVPQTAIDSESLRFGDLRCWPRLSQPATQSDALSGSFLRLEDGRQKCRPHVDRNRRRDSRAPSLRKTPGHRLPRLPPSESRRSGIARPATVLSSVRAPSHPAREYSTFRSASRGPLVSLPLLIHASGRLGHTQGQTSAASPLL